LREIVTTLRTRVATLETEVAILQMEATVRNLSTFPIRRTNRSALAAANFDPTEPIWFTLPHGTPLPPYSVEDPRGGEDDPPRTLRQSGNIKKDRMLTLAQKL